MFKNKRWIRAFLVGVSLLFAGLFIAPAQMNATTPEANPDELDQNRARLLTYVLKRQVENHFSGKEIDDTLSYAAFDLYLKQLDYQKRLLLAEEVSQLEIFKDRIDDEVQSGRVILAPLAFRLLANSISRAALLAEKSSVRTFLF